VSPVRFELGFYIPDYGILHSYGRENLKSYIILPRLNPFPDSLEANLHQIDTEILFLVVRRTDNRVQLKLQSIYQ
jgi:hypothetical protein